MKKAAQAYRLLNILSLDVVAGAMICASFFSQVFQVSALPYGLASLGLTVWVIYTADHLIDAKRVQQLASTKRHLFHQKYFKVLFLFWVLAGLIDGVLLFFIRAQVVAGGILLASVVLIYFVLQRYLKFMKELIGALLYSGGVLLIPLSVKNGPISETELLLILQFALTALINLLIFSWFDKRRDERDNHISFTTVFGEQVTKKIVVLLLVVNLLLSAKLMIAGTVEATLVILTMNAILLIIFWIKKYFETEDRYRLLGDAIFLIPLIYLVA